MREPIAALLVLVACGGPARRDPTPPSTLSADRHLEEAAAKEREARVHQDEADSYAKAPLTFHCNTNAASEQLTIGGERPRQLVPCTSIEREAAERHQREASAAAADAQRHRAIAHALLEDERKACVGLSMDELATTPFGHREQIAAVERTGGGARIRFRAGAGLTVEALRRAIGCHRARASTQGHDPSFMPYDPTLVPDAMVTVAGDAGSVVVTVVAPDGAGAATVWSRAEPLRP